MRVHFSQFVSQVNSICGNAVAGQSACSTYLFIGPQTLGALVLLSAAVSSWSVFVSLLPAGQVSRSALKQPRSCNIFKALFCCLQAQDGPKSPALPPPPPPPSPSQQGLLESQENGMVVKVTVFAFQRYFRTAEINLKTSASAPAFTFVYLRSYFLVAHRHTHTHTACHKRGVWIV